MNLVFLGPPGAGKGTQAERLAAYYKLARIASGDLMRKEIQAGTPLGLQIKACVERGELSDESLVNGLIQNAIQQNASGKGIVFDGFPRTLYQAEALSRMLQDRGLHLNKAIYLVVDEKTLIERITGRFQCANCGEIYHRLTKKPQQEGVCDRCGGTSFTQRSDDKEGVLRTRLAVYNSQTAPVIEYYQAHGMLATIDGDQTVEAVWDQIIMAVSQGKSATAGNAT